MDRRIRRGLPGHRPSARPERLHAGRRGRHGGKKNSEGIDLTAFGCPLHYVKARNELRRIPAGTTAGFLFGSEKLAQQAAESLRKDGHEILSVKSRGVGVLVNLRKTGTAGPDHAAAVN